MARNFASILAALALSLCMRGTALAQVPGPLLVVDENGNSNFSPPGTLQPDPGPGGLPQVLTYHLPFAGLPGDVLMQDGVGGPVLDVIRFNGNGTLLFYSDNVDGFDALADTPSPPSAFYPNQITIQEIGTEANNGAFYQPTPNQPGFDPSFPNYHFISDGAIPEPSSLMLLVVGCCAMGILRRMITTSRRRRT
jgi:hypothetical protein